MERKTKITAEEGKQYLDISREFDLPLELLFKAYSESAIVEQWMGTKVLKLSNEQHGGYQFETTNAQGILVFRANGAIHDFVPNQKITRTFEMENTPFPVQLEYLEFEKITEEKSRLRIRIVYKTIAHRDQVLQLPFAQGINMAHNKLQDMVSKLNNGS
ncbi:MAG: SRPBCC domain-containing protein [Rhizobacter sp.]|nr:SRPBCC domain-containing protein [Ferruginibacter sp.]